MIRSTVDAFTVYNIASCSPRNMHVDIIQIRASAGPNAEQIPQDFFITRFFENHGDYIEVLDPDEQIYDRWEGLLREERQTLEEQLDEFEEVIGRDLIDILFSPIEEFVSVPQPDPDPLPHSWKFSGEVDGGRISVVTIRIGSGDRRTRWVERGYRGRYVTQRDIGGEQEPFWIIVSNTKEEVTSFIDYLESEIHNIESTLSDFVQLENFRRGEDIVADFFDRLMNEGDYVTDWRVDQTDDEFETEVFDAVNSLTGVCLPNVNVESSVGESPEYDVVTLPLGPLGQSYAVEAKNYDRQHVDEENLEFDDLRYNLITQPKEEAERVDLNLITVVKGLEDDQYDNLKRHAGPSNVLLLNENNYRDELENTLLTQNLNILKRLIR